MGFLCGIVFIVLCVVFSELFSTGVALAFCHWLDKKNQKKKRKKNERVHRHRRTRMYWFVV